MSHWAEIDQTNKVIRVLVGDNNDPAGDEGYQWLIDNLGGNWIKTSYNAKTNGFRKNFAGEGFIYDKVRDAFISTKPFESWILNEKTCEWEAPISKPDNGKFYEWNEEKKSWDEVQVIFPTLPNP